MATLNELNQLLNDPALKDKVQAGIVVVAMEVVEESPQPANHAQRVSYAKQALQSPQGEADAWIRVLLGKNSNASQSAIQNVDDATVLSNIRDSWDTFSGE